MLPEGPPQEDRSDRDSERPLVEPLIPADLTCLIGISQLFAQGEKLGEHHSDCPLSIGGRVVEPTYLSLGFTAIGVSHVSSCPLSNISVPSEKTLYVLGSARPRLIGLVASDAHSVEA